MGSRAVSTARARGTSCQEVEMGPSVTLTSQAPSLRQSSGPPRLSISTSVLPVSSNSSHATQRVALPQAWASLPSVLWMPMKAEAPGERGASMVMTCSAPTPSCTSQMRMISSFDGSGAVRQSRNTKWLRRPCILMKGLAKGCWAGGATVKKSVTGIMGGECAPACLSTCRWQHLAGLILLAMPQARRRGVDTQGQSSEHVTKQ